MPSTKAQVIVWVITVLLAGRLVFVAVQHDMPILDTAAIALLAAYGLKAAIENLTTSVARARNGTKR
ncbi:hypothetical protein [Streptomyces sp. AC555_RSS877]|uniref:hypothetical protein n=1 Tax=Streptomyces sp. AC555_RSS877 TaxID=2823688 RepID=UPI001C27CBD6|nr:hypothetical protein [Streptomyces sp. AC555_RSS877]